jgi:hypothetical protein
MSALRSFDGNAGRRDDLVAKPIFEITASCARVVLVVFAESN